METVGFIGLGNMGGPVAGHIQSAGFSVCHDSDRNQSSGRSKSYGAHDERQMGGR
jgi:3-hydroxyisobutyrate dehydrogenase-like beta-hydroxyacid dehydrogenase